MGLSSAGRQTPEELAVHTFSRNLRQAAQEFIEIPLGPALLPNWNRVISAIPEFFDLLLDSIHNQRQAARNYGI